MAIETREEHNGAILTGALVKFAIASSGKLVITNQNNDTEVYSFELMGLRRESTNSDDDYVRFTPVVTFDNDNNYEILAAGSYAVRATMDADVIVAVEE